MPIKIDVDFRTVSGGFKHQHRAGAMIFFTAIIYVSFCFQCLDAFPFFFNLRFFGDR
jgi:hypothetical protein